MTIEMINEPVSKFTNRQIIVVASDLTVTDAARSMTEEKVDSILVFEKEEVIGILTIRDILCDIIAKGKDPSQVTIKEITRSPLIDIDQNAKVKEALELMTNHDIRRLIVTDNKKAIGIISRKKVIGETYDCEISLPELEIPHKIKCPYCSSIFEGKDELSSHIDDIHIGKGLFEGNISKKEELGTI